MPLPRESDWRRALEIAQHATQSGTQISQLSIALYREGLKDDGVGVAAIAKRFFDTADKARERYEESLNEDY